MFFAEFLVGLMWLATRRPDDEKVTAKQAFIFTIPASFDVIASTMTFIGLMLTTASIY